MKLFTTIITLGALSMFGASASSSQSLELGPVGPPPIPTVQESESGSLQVFSERQKIEFANLGGAMWIGDHDLRAMLYKPAHTDYTILGSDGGVVQNVKNADYSDDPTPARISLPAGVYTVVAQARDHERVHVKVIIKPGQLTTVNLDTAWASPQKRPNRQDYVWLGDMLVGSRESASGGLTAR